MICRDRSRSGRCSGWSIAYWDSPDPRSVYPSTRLALDNEFAVNQTSIEDATQAEPESPFLSKRKAVSPDSSVFLLQLFFCSPPLLLLLPLFPCRFFNSSSERNDNNSCATAAMSAETPPRGSTWLGAAIHDSKHKSAGELAYLFTWTHITGHTFSNPSSFVCLQSPFSRPFSRPPPLTNEVLPLPSDRPLFAWRSLDWLKSHLLRVFIGI